MPTEPERHDVGETHPERVIREGKTDQRIDEKADSVKKVAEQKAGEVQSKVRGELLGVAALMGAIALVGWLIAGQDADESKSFAVELRDANVEGCERQNEVRAAFRADLRDDILGVQEEIEASRATDSALFPDIPRQKFRALVEKGVERDKARIARKRSRISNLIDTNCEAEYPD